MRSRFDNQLAELNRELIEMGAMCEESISAFSAMLMDSSHIAPISISSLFSSAS